MNNNNSSSLVFRYPSPNMKPIKKDLSNENKKTMANNNSFTRFSSQITNSTQIKQNIENITTKNCETIDQSLNKSQINSMTANKENNNKFIQLFEKLNFENNHLKEKLADLEKKIENPKLFKNTDNILDFRGFIKTNFEKYNELLNELYENKGNLENEQKNLEITQKDYEINKKKETSKTINEEQSKKNQNLQQRKEKLERQLINLNEELASAKEKQNHYKEKINKKDFFADYDRICKEVDELRRMNFTLTETLKKYIPVQEPN